MSRDTDKVAIRHCQGLMESLASAPLMPLPGGRRLTIADGPIPLLVTFTREDQAAKGLRSLRDGESKPSEPVYLSALEAMQLQPATLLIGASGTGKTVFAHHLALHLAGEATGSHAFNHDHLAQPVQHAASGAESVNAWRLGALVPVLCTLGSGSSLASHLTADAHALLSRQEGALLILDVAEGSSADAIDQALAWQKQWPALRILAIARDSDAQTWALPTALTRYTLRSLLPVQRAAFVRRVLPALSSVPAAVDASVAETPLYFALALSLADVPIKAVDLFENWLATTLEASVEDRAALVQVADQSLTDRVPPVWPPTLAARIENRGLAALLGATLVQQALAVTALREMDPEAIAHRFERAPFSWSAPIDEAFSARPAQPVMDALLGLAGDAGLRAALLVSQNSALLPATRDEAFGRLLVMIEQGRLAAADRVEAGRLLARHGDPRDLAALAEVPGGRFTMGSHTHPNSAPPHEVAVAPFRIGLYPVVNRDYQAFVDASGRPWPSLDGRDPDRANAPAVDLSWHDARAYCAWLTLRWRESGRIGPLEVVRLPSEPEWEFAARGFQPDSRSIVYPWGLEWDREAVNSEESGFNTTTAVGVFPRGRSPLGCFDMAGQVWEWTTTLWGDDMARPSFRYPYRADDGREALDAGPAIRRVLRGGCFSSGALKACCTYRGSLEPAGWWRGNGFRVVVAKLAGRRRAEQHDYRATQLV